MIVLGILLSSSCTVPILDRPEERSQWACLGRAIGRFLSSNPRSSRRTIAISRAVHVRCFGWRVPILDRPEERSQCFVDCSFTKRFGFQSSIVPKNDRNPIRQKQYDKPDKVPILDRPEERSQSDLLSMPMNAEDMFQSSIVPKNDRNFGSRLSVASKRSVPILDRPEERSQFF